MLAIAALDVDRLAQRGQGCLQSSFRECGMSVDRVDDLLEGRLESAADRELVDHLGRLGTDNVDAENFAGRLVGDHLDEAFGLAERYRLATGREREAPDRDLASRFPGA